MLIRSYGLFWRREDVFWGKPKMPGRLLGKNVKAVKGRLTDFREQSGIYVLYANYQLVYIGQAGAKNSKLFSRLRQHCNDQLAERWDRFSWFGTCWVKKDGTLSLGADVKQSEISKALDQIEAILIHTSEPPHNRQGGKFGNAQKFIQFRDEEMLGPTTEEMIGQIWKELC